MLIKAYGYKFNNTYENLSLETIGLARNVSDISICTQKNTHQPISGSE